MFGDPVDSGATAPATGRTMFGDPVDSTPGQSGTPGFWSTVFHEVLPATILGKIGGSDIASGIESMTQPGVDPKLEGVHQIATGAGKMALPLVAPYAIANPLSFATALGTGLVGQKIGSTAAEAFGAPPGASDLIGDASGLASGGLAGGITGPGAKAAAMRLLKTPGAPKMVGGGAEMLAGAGAVAHGEPFFGVGMLARGGERFVRGLQEKKEGLPYIERGGRGPDTSGRTPLWNGVVLTPPPGMETELAIPSDLPSGRKVGPVASSPAPARVPAWRTNSSVTPEIPAPPSFEPIPGELPSGRKVGGIANQSTEPSTAPPRPPSAADLSDVAKSLGYKGKFENLPPNQQAAVKRLAELPAKTNGAPSPIQPPPSSSEPALTASELKAMNQQVNRDAHVNARDIFGKDIGHDILHDAAQQVYGTDSWGKLTLKQKTAINEYIQSNQQQLMRLNDPGKIVQAIKVGVQGQSATLSQ